MYSQIYGFLIKNLFPGKIIRTKLKELERTQWLSPPELEAIQLKKIQQLVNYAYKNVPFYRKLYQREKIKPQDIRSIKDFRYLPFVKRDDVKNHRKDMIATGYRGPVSEGRTSGSTGTPMRFITDRTAKLLTNAFNIRSRGWYGVKPGDKRAFVTATVEDYSNWHWRERMAARINRHRFFNVRTMNETKMKSFAKMLVKWQPALIRAYPSALATFVNYLKEQKITDIRPNLVEVTAEKITVSQRKLFEDFFRAPVADHYASLEIYSYGYQCPDGGLHVNEDRYFELVEEDQIVSPGRIGEVVVTALNQYAMPFIRYKNGDMAVFESNGCPCERGLLVLKEVVGRNCDWLVHQDGQAVHWAPVTDVMEAQKKIRQYQIYQPDRKNLEVRIVCTEHVDYTFPDKIINDMQSLFGPSMHITVKQLDHIELTAGGKHAYVVSEVKPDFI